MRSIIIATLFSSSVCLLCAQVQSPVQSAASTPEALEVKRVPPPPKSIPPLLQQYDFGAQIQALQQTNGIPMPPGTTPEFATGKPVTTAPVPKDYRPKADVPLTPTALEAVRVSERWRGETNNPATGRDGRVLYSFGAGLPTVVCAPLRVCIIELQAGEKIIGEPQIGDSVRWNVSPAMYGTGDGATQMIVLKPQTPGLDTDLLITTDRRAYYIRLISKPEEYVARVAFAYPDDNNRNWNQHIAEQRAAALQTQHSTEVLPAMIAVENMHFNYKIRGDEHIRPLRVFDDGAKTFIQMPADIQHREAPVLVVVGSDGKGQMTNYRVKQQTYIVDRLFDRADLVLGAGKKAQKVEITRERPKG
jgi:type IV secretion system protein VirB9